MSKRILFAILQPLMEVSLVDREKLIEEIERREREERERRQQIIEEEKRHDKADERITGWDEPENPKKIKPEMES